MLVALADLIILANWPFSFARVFQLLEPSSKNSKKLRSCSRNRYFTDYFADLVDFVGHLRRCSVERFGFAVHSNPKKSAVLGHWC